MWTEKHDSRGIVGNFCGDPNQPDLMNRYQEIIFLHSEEDLLLVFGTTMEDDPDHGWWGISDI